MPHHPRTGDHEGDAGHGIRALLLDVDDTLVDTRGAMRAAAADCLATVWPDAGDRADELGVRYHADPGGFFGRYTRGELTFEEMRESRLREVAAQGGFPWGSSSFEAFEGRWPEAFRSRVVVFPDVARLLDRAAADGLLVGALTNSSRSFTELKLEAVGLTGAFGAVATTDTLGFGKPDPRAFVEACRLLRTSAAETAYVGDDLVVDAQAAGAAGLHGIWLDRRGEWDGRDVGVAVVRSLDEVRW